MFQLLGVLDQMSPEKCNFFIMPVHMIFLELGQWLRQKGNREIVSDKLLGSIRVEVQKYNTSGKETLVAPWEIMLNALRFHLLKDHGVKKLKDIEPIAVGQPGVVTI